MKKFLPFLLLILVTLGVYAPAVRNDFVWDDHALVLRDPLIRSWRLIPEGFQHFLFTDATASDFYRPIQRLTYTLEYAAIGFRPALYHFDSIALHLLAALALYVFARGLLRSFGAEDRTSLTTALIAAIIWAIHPVQTSAVAYISGRADSLAALFGFSGLACALWAMRSTKMRQLTLLITAVLLLLTSALSKEAGLIFLGLWLTIAIAQRNWRATWQAGLASFFVLVTYASLRLPAEHIPAPGAAVVPILVRPIIFARAIAEYTGLILVPWNLHMDRDVMTHPFGFSNASLNVAAWRELQTLAGILLLAAFFFWLLRERKRDRVVFTCLILAGFTYLPVSSAFLLNATVAEHWLYLPSAFLILAFVRRLMLSRATTILSLVRPISFSLLALWMIFLAGRTFVRVADWKDQRTFFERTIACGGDSARMLINLGALELKEGHLEEAKKNFSAALAKEPGQPFAVLNLAAVAIKQSDFKTAHELLARATQMPLVEAEAYEQMAVLEAKETGRANIMRLRLASRTGHSNWSIEKRYIKLLDEMGNTDAALKEARGCAVTQWYRAETWQLFAELLQKSGAREEALQASIKAHRYDVHLK